MKERKLTIVDDNDVPFGSAYKKDIVKNKWNYRCVHIFLFNKKGELLIGKRPPFKRRFPNKWSSGAGGKVDDGDSYEDAAYREMKEELGVRVDLKKHSKYIYLNELYGYTVFHELFVGKAEGGFKPDPSEIEKLKWATIDWVKKDVKNNPEKYATPFIEALKSYLKG